MLGEGEIYLNAGTFSAMPRQVYDSLIAFIAAAEANPTRIAAGNKLGPLWRVQQLVAGYLGADPADMVFHANVTQALNQALMCHPWPAKGEILASSSEYGSIVIAMEEVARRRGLTVRRFDLPDQPASDQELVDVVTNALSGDTVAVLLSHLTCDMGLVTPIAAIGRELRKRGIVSIIDGAHAPGLLPVNLAEMNVDYYGGNLHKWFMGPKGTGFLYVARHMQAAMEPHIVGFGGTMRTPGVPHDGVPGLTSRFVYAFNQQGLRDVSGMLAMEATLTFRGKLGEQAILGRIAALGDHVRRKLGDELGLKRYSAMPPLNAGLIAFEPPPAWRDKDASDRMYREHRITVPIFTNRARGPILRVSPHIWNSEADIDRLAEALAR